MPTVSLRLAALCAFAALCGLAFGDTVVLTSGEKLEGKILSETPTEVTLEVKVSAGVIDQQTIPRAKIAKVEKAAPDALAWEAIKGAKLGANSQSDEQYDAAMRPLQAFINEYPTSAHAAEATQLLTAFAEEKRRVDGGEVRIGDKWLTREEVAKESYQIRGMLDYQNMRAQRQAGDVIGALNTFDSMEKNFPGCKAFPDAVEAAREALAALKTAVDRAQQGYAAMQNEFAAGVAAAIPAEREELKNARKRELARGEAALAAAEKAHLKWPVLVPRSDKNIAALAQKIPTEQSRLASINVAKMRESITRTEAAQAKLAANNAEADDLLRQAVTDWPANELAKRLQPEAAALKALAKATPAPVAQEAPKATPAPTTPRPVATPAPTPAPEPETSFFLSAKGIILILVLLALIFGGLIVFKRFRDRSNEGIE